MRVKRGIKARKRRKRILKLAEGFRGRSKNTIRQGQQRVKKALYYAYRDRKVRKRDFRSLWIVRINAAARECGISYSQLMKAMKAAGIEVDRKVLAELGISQPAAFKAVVEMAKSNRAA